MSFSVNTNLASLAALQTLNMTEQMLTQTQNVISTGQSVASAQDNPALYSISNTIQAGIASLTAVQNNLSFGQSTLGVASNAAAQISSQLATLQQTVTQADQVGINPATMQNQVNAILTNINQFATTATFNGVNLLDNVTTTQLNIVQDTLGNSVSVTNQDATTTGLGLTGINVNQTSAGASIQLAGLGNVASTAITASSAFTFTTKVGTAAAVTFSVTFSTAANSVTPTTGSTIDPAATGATINVQLGTSTAETMTNPISAVNSVQGKLPNVYVPGSATVNETGQLFSAVIDSQGNLSIASGNNAIGMGTGSVTSILNTAGTAIAEAAPTGSGLQTGGAQQAILIVQNAITLMNAKAAVLGSAEQQVTGLQNFNTQLSASFTSGVGALTDANMAAESAQLASLQTKQQLGIQSLSMANARPQMMLQLFR